jgi:hypothetical protein
MLSPDAPVPLRASGNGLVWEIYRPTDNAQFGGSHATAACRVVQGMSAYKVEADPAEQARLYGDRTPSPRGGIDLSVHNAVAATSI